MLSNDQIDRLKTYLLPERGFLYAVLDAARDGRVYPYIMRQEKDRESLWTDEGEGDEIAPWLAELTPRSWLLDALFRHGWGESWGMLVNSRRSFKQLRRHLRRFLYIRTELGEKLYFRFYDPRVLRVFLPTCDKAQLDEFFGALHGEVDSLFVEDEDPRFVLRYSRNESGTLEIERLNLDGAPTDTPR